MSDRSKAANGTVARRRMAGGANQSGLREHNERVLLSLVRDDGPIASSELARKTSLSAQTVSVIMRSLEQEGYLERGDPIRGRVGKPSVPLRLAPRSAWSFGLKIGRRSADLVLMDLTGVIAEQQTETYDYPVPSDIFAFLARGLDDLGGSIPEGARAHGLGIATPFELWNWHELMDAPSDAFELWRDVDIADSAARHSDLPIYVTNDATAACRAEHHFGVDHGFTNYAYFFVGAFIGGGVILNDTVYEGPHDNAGAFGSMSVTAADGTPAQLLDIASIYRLESSVSGAGGDRSILWRQPKDWSSVEDMVSPWIDAAGDAIAQSSISACAVADLEGIVIDGAFPASVRARLRDRVDKAMDRLDTRGLVRPEIVEGSVGENARVIGAAYAPLSAQFFIDGNTGLRRANQ